MAFLFYTSVRDHPELRGYSDEERLRLMMQARARRGDLMWVMPLICVGILAIVMAVAAALAGAIVANVRGSASMFADPRARDVFSFALLLFGPGAVFTWLAVRRELILRSVLNNLVRAKCPYCLFNLAGLPIEMGGVTCPECGQRILLSEEGYTPEDLLPNRGGYATWKPRKAETVELPPIPLEPEAPKGRKKRIVPFGIKDRTREP